jgi:hypothetical protein
MATARPAPPTLSGWRQVHSAPAVDEAPPAETRAEALSGTRPEFVNDCFYSVARSPCGICAALRTARSRHRHLPTHNVEFSVDYCFFNYCFLAVFSKARMLLEILRRYYLG